MITNERQLQIAKAKLDDFEKAVEETSRGAASQTDLHPLVKEAQLEALHAQHDELAAEIQNYAELRNGQVRSFELASLGDLPAALINARIAAGLTQGDLAKRLSLKEQQIQRYEANVYEGASFTRISDVADAIGVDIPGSVKLLHATSADAILKRVRMTGINDDLIRRRVMPSISGAEPDINVLASRLEALFGWSQSDITSGEQLAMPNVGGQTARYKLPKGRNARAVAGYSAYAYGMAQICAGAMREQPRKTIPTDWQDFLDYAEQARGPLTFESALDAAWDMGVVVLPLSDVGSFHGACWRIDHVNVVVLKQKTCSSTRWLHDLLHELFHAAQRPQESSFAVIEAPETSEERRLDKEERAATWFASQVTLRGRAEELFKQTLANARNDMRRLKRAATSTAAEEGADVGALANYIAFRLSLQGENWWGAAQNLQEVGGDPLKIARDRFFDRFDFGPLDHAQHQLLTIALNEEVPHG